MNTELGGVEPIPDTKLEFRLGSRFQVDATPVTEKDLEDGRLYLVGPCKYLMRYSHFDHLWNWHVFTCRTFRTCYPNESLATNVWLVPVELRKRLALEKEQRDRFFDRISAQQAPSLMPQPHDFSTDEYVPRPFPDPQFEPCCGYWE